MKTYERIILTVLREVAAQRGADPPVPERGHTLVHDLGLKSLDLAQVVATLELRLRADPFARLVPITSVRTVGDLCDAYESYFERGAIRAPGAPDGDSEGGGPARQRATEFSAAETRRRLRGPETV